ncbi:hypothetical protein HOY82DRAFT_132815 [Tuber indicum]|nr:hypothetical protein HOY82DRAFT_132815 [Tuber indicum]
MPEPTLRRNFLRVVTTPSLFLIILLTSLTFPLPPLASTLTFFLFLSFLFSNSLPHLPFHPIPCPPHPWALAHHQRGYVVSALACAPHRGGGLHQGLVIIILIMIARTRRLEYLTPTSFPTNCGVINSLQGPPPSHALFCFLSNKQQLSITTSYA